MASSYLDQRQSWRGCECCGSTTATLLRDRNRRITNLLDGYDLNAIAKQSGEQVWEGTLTLATGERNQEITTAIPIGEILRDPQPGIYIVPRRAGQSGPGQLREPGHAMVGGLPISGCCTLRGDDGLHVFCSFAGRR